MSVMVPSKAHSFSIHKHRHEPEGVRFLRESLMMSDVDLDDDFDLSDSDVLEDSEPAAVVSTGSGSSSSAAKPKRVNVRLRDASQFERWKKERLKYEYLTLIQTNSSDGPVFHVVCETCKVRSVSFSGFVFSAIVFFSETHSNF